MILESNGRLNEAYWQAVNYNLINLHVKPFAKASERVFSKFKKMDPSITSVLIFFKGYRKSLNGKNERQLFQKLKNSLMNLPDRKNLRIYKFLYLQI